MYCFEFRVSSGLHKLPCWGLGSERNCGGTPHRDSAFGRACSSVASQSPPSLTSHNMNLCSWLCKQQVLIVFDHIDQLITCLLALAEIPKDSHEEHIHPHVAILLPGSIIMCWIQSHDCVVVCKKMPRHFFLFNFQSLNLCEFLNAQVSVHINAHRPGMLVPHHCTTSDQRWCNLYPKQSTRSHLKRLHMQVLVVCHVICHHCYLCCGGLTITHITSRCTCLATIPYTVSLLLLDMHALMTIATMKRSQGDGGNLMCIRFFYRMHCFAKPFIRPEIS